MSASDTSRNATRIVCLYCAMVPSQKACLRVIGFNYLAALEDRTGQARPLYSRC